MSEQPFDETQHPTVLAYLDKECVVVEWTQCVVDADGNVTDLGEAEGGWSYRCPNGVLSFLSIPKDAQEKAELAAALCRWFWTLGIDVAICERAAEAYVLHWTVTALGARP